MRTERSIEEKLSEEIRRRGSIRTTTYKGALDFHARLTVDRIIGSPEMINVYFGLIWVYQAEYKNRLSWLNNVGRKNTL